MFENITLDQLKILVVISEEGSFSAAAEKLHRVQSAISYGIRNLETSLGYELFDRSQRKPALTESGEAILLEAKKVLLQMESLQQRSSSISGGLEAKVSIVFDVMFPMKRVVALCRKFYQKFPDVTLIVHTDALSAIQERVLNDSCKLGIAGSLHSLGSPFVSEKIAEIELIPVASPYHPLGNFQKKVSLNKIRKYVQIVLTDRGEGSKGEDRGVLAEKTWRVADLSTKKAFLIEGLGWGNMPKHTIEEELSNGKLVRLSLESWKEESLLLPLYLFYKESSPPKTAGKWLISKLREMAPNEKK